MRTTLWVPVFVSLALALGCGGDSSGPKVPTGGGGTRFLTVSVTSDVIKCGKCETFTATLTTASGTTQTVTANWRTDMPSVATIDSAGSLTALAQGDVTVIATYEDLQAAKLVHVVHDYQGAWLGQYLVTACQESGAFREFCAGTFQLGAVLPLSLDLIQERAMVTGDLWLGAVETSLTGTVGNNGELTGEAKGSFTDEDGTLDNLVSPLRLVRQGSRIGDGTFTLTITANGYPGSVRVDARVMGLDPWTGEGASHVAAARPRTIREALRARPRR